MESIRKILSNLGSWIWLVLVLLVVAIIVILVMGAKEALVLIVAGIAGMFGFCKNKGNELKKQHEESKRETDIQVEKFQDKVTDIREQQKINDKEVERRVEEARTEVNNMGIDDLVARGNDMLRQHGIGGNKET